MRVYVLLLFIIISLTSCKEDKQEVENLARSFYPYTERLEYDYGYYFLDDNSSNIILKKKIGSDDDKIQFYDLQKDTLIKRSYNYTYPVFGHMNMIKKGTSYFVLFSDTHTMGKKKTQDFIIKYNVNFEKIEELGLGIEKYPSAKSFLLQHNNDFIYVTNGFEFRQTERIVLRKYDAQLGLIKEKSVSSKISRRNYRPLFARVVNNEILIISDRTVYGSKKKVYEMMKLDLDFKVIWHKQLNITEVIDRIVDCSGGNRIAIVCGKYKNSINLKDNISFYDYNGEFKGHKEFPNQTFIDLRSNQGYLYAINELVNRDGAYRHFYKLDTIGNIVDSKKDNRSGSYHFNKQRIAFSNDRCYVFQINEDKLKISPVFEGL